MDNINDTGLTHFIALEAAKGASVPTLCLKFDMSPEVMSRWRWSQGVVDLVDKYRQDITESTRLKLASLCFDAVEELDRLIKRPSTEPREAIAAIALAFQVGLVKEPSSVSATVLKGGSKKTLEEIREKLLKRRV